MSLENIGRISWRDSDTNLLHALVKEGIVDARKFVSAFNNGAKDKRTAPGISARLHHEFGLDGYPAALRESFNMMLRPLKRQRILEKKQAALAAGTPFITIAECMEILGVSAERVRQLGLSSNGAKAKVRKSIDPQTNLVIYSKPDILAYKAYRDARPVEVNKRKQLELNLTADIPVPAKPTVVAKVKRAVEAKAAPEVKKVESGVVRSRPATTVSEIVESASLQAVEKAQLTPINKAVDTYAKERETARITLEAYTIGLIPLSQFITQMRKMLVANN